jgi:hypothetical protein
MVYNLWRTTQQPSAATDIAPMPAAAAAMPAE